MKTIKHLAFLILSVSLIFMAFINIKLGSIIGKLNPINGAKMVIIIKGTDTLKASLNNGQFKFSNLVQDVYNIQIIANEPYRNSLIENVAVKDSSTTNVGEIKLLQ